LANGSCEPLGVGRADLRIEFPLMFVQVVRFCPFERGHRDEQSAESLLSAQRFRRRWMPYWRVSRSSLDELLDGRRRVHGRSMLSRSHWAVTSSSADPVTAR
jgi:hypothetical protein